MITRPLASLTLPATAMADKQELYTFATFELQLTSFTEPIAASASATQFTPAIELGAFYGFTNTLHIGAVCRASLAHDLRVDTDAVSAEEAANEIRLLLNRGERDAQN